MVTLPKVLVDLIMDYHNDLLQHDAWITYIQYTHYAQTLDEFSVVHRIRLPLLQWKHLHPAIKHAIEQLEELTDWFYFSIEGRWC